MADVIYRDEQAPPLWALVVLLVVTGYSVWIGIEERSWVATVISSIVLFGTSTARVRVEVRRSGVTAAWRPLRKRVLPWTEIVSVEPVHYNPLRDYGGWGIRYSQRKGWAYTMKGNRGVLLTLRSAKPLLVGTEHADQLAAAIGSILARTPSDEAER